MCVKITILTVSFQALYVPRNIISQQLAWDILKVVPNLLPGKCNTKHGSPSHTPKCWYPALGKSLQKLFNVSWNNPRCN